jgi:hypothetical protein
MNHPLKEPTKAISHRSVNMESQLSGPHRKVYDRIFQHPMPHNLEWREVWSMLSAMGDTKTLEENNGNLKVTRNGQTLVLHRSRTKVLADKRELMHIRHFLERSGAPVPTSASAGTHMLVVIDHREARIYDTEMHGSVPQRITPYDPFGFGRDLHYNQDEAVAKTLRGAKQVLMFGSATGASSAMEALVAELKQNHADIAERIVGTFTIDEHHLSEDQLLAKARELFVAGT